MAKPVEPAPIYEVDLNPADLTLFEYRQLEAYWRSRTDHFNFCATLLDDFYDVVRRVGREDPVRTVGYDESGWIEIRGDVPVSWREVPGEWNWLAADIGPGGLAHFKMLDVRAYCGDLEFVAVHDNDLRQLLAVHEELPFYRGFGLEDRAFRPADDLRAHQTWRHIRSLGSILGGESGPPDRWAGNRRLDSTEVVALHADIVGRHPAVPPLFDFSPDCGVSGRALVRERLARLRQGR